MAGAAAGGAIKDGHTLCVSTESRTETSAAGSETKRLDLGGDVAARRRESRHVSAKIQAFRLASRGAVFGTALRRAAKSVSILDGAVGGGNDHRFRLP